MFYYSDFNFRTDFVYLFLQQRAWTFGGKRKLQQVWNSKQYWVSITINKSIDIIHNGVLTLTTTIFFSNFILLCSILSWNYLIWLQQVTLQALKKPFLKMPIFPPFSMPPTLNSRSSRTSPSIPIPCRDITAPKIVICLWWWMRTPQNTSLAQVRVHAEELNTHSGTYWRMNFWSLKSPNCQLRKINIS